MLMARTAFKQLQMSSRDCSTTLLDALGIVTFAEGWCSVAMRNRFDGFDATMISISGSHGGQQSEVSALICHDSSSFACTTVVCAAATAVVSIVAVGVRCVSVAGSKPGTSMFAKTESSSPPKKSSSSSSVSARSPTSTCESDLAPVDNAVGVGEVFTFLSKLTPSQSTQEEKSAIHSIAIVNALISILQCDCLPGCAAINLSWSIRHISAQRDVRILVAKDRSVWGMPSFPSRIVNAKAVALRKTNASSGQITPIALLDPASAITANRRQSTIFEIVKSIQSWFSFSISILRDACSWQCCIAAVARTAISFDATATSSIEHGYLAVPVTILSVLITSVRERN
mmetsp:Transcript_18539/g.51553  ORF Transcript_18539/g.51553 Transcript_18539/m.51553 type:complete len:343 (+) Transcript_18539:899-1927(+)